ncbi:hypothetical protein P154DRAFT_300416 [Amniculicola lignicola CBS 123094]|uniref:Uncharacterized protein n=1 Tax=Amniculicola lignicola CBS 123094 TaxID=1392246 RepID=A0A6A5WCZ7_9PLEO|nr:hypothetical protein P154DRAFT_300416 [Amniculicola lignicola CBS 123094]
MSLIRIKRKNLQYLRPYIQKLAKGDSSSSSDGKCDCDATISPRQASTPDPHVVEGSINRIPFTWLPAYSRARASKDWIIPHDRAAREEMSRCNSVLSHALHGYNEKENVAEPSAGNESPTEIRREKSEGTPEDCSWKSASVSEDKSDTTLNYDDVPTTEQYVPNSEDLDIHYCAVIRSGRDVFSIPIDSQHVSGPVRGNIQAVKKAWKWAVETGLEGKVSLEDIYKLAALMGSEDKDGEDDDEGDHDTGSVGTWTE